MHFLLAVIVLVLAMAVKDMLGTAMVVFEANGKGKLAGATDAAGDIVNFIYTVVGVDALNKAGFSLDAAIMLIAVAATSYNTTKFTTNYLANRNKKKPVEVPDLEAK